tara:strand:+ start:276 stop:383 length:108 start_codon:yes stop_codon:yes gene_type:complete
VRYRKNDPHVIAVDLGDKKEGGFTGVSGEAKSTSL